AGAAAQVDVAVLFGLAESDGFGVIREITVAAVGRGVVGERLGAGVQDRPIGGGTTDDGGHHSHRAVVPGCGSAGDHAAVVVDVRPGPVLGDKRRLVDAEPAGRAASGDDVRFQ